MSDKNNGFATLVIVGIFVLITIIYAICYGATDTTTTFTVKRLDRVQKEKSSHWVVFSKEGEVFSNEDSWTFLKFNSSDIQGQLSEGDTVTAEVAGWRVEFLSSYRNIIQIKEIKHPEPKVEPIEVKAK